MNGNRTVDHREIADISYDFDENETGVETDIGDFLDPLYPYWLKALRPSSIAQ